MHVIAEMPEFSQKAPDLLGKSEFQALITHLAENPCSGAIMVGTGGIRKLRWVREGMGKSGGARVIYYFHDHRIPLYLLSIFGKNEKANLTAAEANELSKLVGLLLKASGI
jgi:hypothetical protein